MINLTIGTNTKRTNVIVEAGQTLAEILAENEVSTQGVGLHLNNSLLCGSDLNRSLADLGVQDGTRASLIAVVKSENA